MQKHLRLDSGIRGHLLLIVACEPHKSRDQTIGWPKRAEKTGMSRCCATNIKHPRRWRTVERLAEPPVRSPFLYIR